MQLGRAVREVRLVCCSASSDTPAPYLVRRRLFLIGLGVAFVCLTVIGFSHVHFHGGQSVAHAGADAAGTRAAMSFHRGLRLIVRLAFAAAVIQLGARSVLRACPMRVAPSVP
jgi:hypothetical protein